jgi:hypothetical protein
LLSQALAQQITVERYVSATGRIESVSPGAVVVVDDEGARHDLQIAEKGEEGVPLKQAGLLLRFPAEVNVFANYGAGALAQGSLVRFQARINRSGQSKGAVSELILLQDATESPQIVERQSPAAGDAPSQPLLADRPVRSSGGELVDVLVTGEVLRASGERLTVLVGENSVTHRDRIAVALAKDARVRMQSDDYRRAEAGDRVTSLRFAVLDSGEGVIQEITVEKQAKPGAPNPTDSEAALVAKYRHLSDEPAPIRDERSRHFLLHTDTSPQSAAILLEKLETMIGLVSGYYGRPPTQMIECYVVRDLAAWPPGALDAAAAESIRAGAGVTQSRTLGRQVRAIVYALDDHGTVQHEAVHAYCSQTFGGTGPVWYAEGMAEMGNYWKGDELAVDIPPAAVYYLRTSPAKSMSEIVAAGQITGDSWEAYQWRWALCYLLANNPNYARQFKGLGIALMTGAANENAGRLVPSRQPAPQISEGRLVPSRRSAPEASFESAYGHVAPQIAFEYDQFLKNLDNGYRVDLCAWQWDKKFVPLQASSRVDARIESNRGWQPTGAAVEKGQAYDFAAEGEWATARGQAPTDASGNPGGAGQLVGAILQDFQLSDPFELSARGAFTAPATGNLYVRCQDAWNALADNEGQVTVHFRKAP